ncbi:MAG TPA: single-stranded DNA-binding protein [Chloroflexia bacterium]|nr:single-stranded DNA-binding protein [Chloroflexia bacterium]
MAGRGLNKVMIIGNLGKDPEMKYTVSGKPITTFSVAVGRTFRSAEGENRDETEWFRVVAWDKLAETCNQFLHKGSKVYIEGRLQTRTWKDTNGADQRMVEVVANEMMMLDSRPGSGGGEYGGGSAPARGGGAPPAEPDFADDDIPF